MLDQADLHDATKEFNFARATELTGSTESFLRSAMEKDLVAVALSAENGPGSLISTPLSKGFALQVESRRVGKIERITQLTVKLVATSASCLIKN